MAEQIAGAKEKVAEGPLEGPFTIEQLSSRDAAVEIITAVAVTIGLTLLWGLEVFRNAFFGLLDRLNLKPHTRQGSAFPPGQPRKLKPRQYQGSSA